MWIMMSVSTCAYAAVSQTFIGLNFFLKRDLFWNLKLVIEISDCIQSLAWNRMWWQIIILCIFFASNKNFSTDLNCNLFFCYVGKIIAKSLQLADVNISSNYSPNFWIRLWEYATKTVEFTLLMFEGNCMEAKPILILVKVIFEALELKSIVNSLSFFMCYCSIWKTFS